eukprot:Tbor_TRINITY_DN4260_c0_g2::TRINITY_DN4260_c0_g2_i2::g.23905::m.23905
MHNTTNGILQNTRRSHLSLINSIVDGELQLMYKDRISPQRHTPPMETGGSTRLVGGEAKRKGAAAPTPYHKPSHTSLTSLHSSVDSPMDQFDRLLANSRPNPTNDTAASLSPFGADGDHDGTLFLTRAVQNTLSDGPKYKELINELSKILQDAEIKAQPLQPSRSPKNSTPSSLQSPQTSDVATESLLKIAKTIREDLLVDTSVSPQGGLHGMPHHDRVTTIDGETTAGRGIYFDPTEVL